MYYALSFMSDPENAHCLAEQFKSKYSGRDLYIYKRNTNDNDKLKCAWVGF